MDTSYVSDGSGNMSRSTEWVLSARSNVWCSVSGETTVIIEDWLWGAFSSGYLYICGHS